MKSTVNRSLKNFCVFSIILFFFTIVFSQVVKGQKTAAVSKVQDSKTYVDSSDVLPYDLAFNMHEFVWSTTLAVSPNGNKAAYAVRQPPPDLNLDARFMPNGSPGSVVGTQIYITNKNTGKTVKMCPGGNCWRPKWSPDGQTLAFYSDADGPPQLWIYNTETEQTRKVSSRRVKAKLWAGDEPQWSLDGNTLYVPLAPKSGLGAWLPTPSEKEDKEEAGSPDEPTVKVMRSENGGKGKPEGPSARVTHFLRENNASMAAVDVETGNVRVLASSKTNPRPSVLRISPSGNWLSYLSVFKSHGRTNQKMTYDLAVVPTAGGEVNLIAEDLPLLRDYHRLNYSWHPTQDQLVYLYNKKLWLVNMGPDGPSTPRRLAPGLGELAPTINWFTRNGEAVVVGFNQVNDKDYRDVRLQGIAIVPLDGSEVIRLPINNDRWVYSGILKADKRTVWQPKGKSVTLKLEERDTGETAIVRFDIDSGQSTVLWKGLGQFRELTAGGNHNFITGIYEDMQTPPDVYRFSNDFSLRNRISQINPDLDRIATGTAKIFETKVPLYDGSLTKVHSAVLLPLGAERGDRLPTIVGIYPGSDVSQYASRFGGGGILTVPNMVFTSRGFAVMLVNLKLGPHGEAGQPLKEMVDVLLPQVYRAAHLGYVDVERLGIGGQSFGGYGTVAVVSGTNLFRAAVAVSGIYDLSGTYGHLGEDGSSFYIGWNEGGQARMGTHPWANLRRYIDNSPYYQAHNIFTPLLLVHGTEDRAYHDAEKMFNALRRLNRPVQLASYEGQGHVIYNWSQANAIDAAQRMVEFFRKHLGNPTTCSERNN